MAGATDANALSSHRICAEFNHKRAITGILMEQTKLPRDVSRSKPVRLRSYLHLHEINLQVSYARPNNAL